MEPFEHEELSDRELDSILQTWDITPAPARLRGAIFGATHRPWWRASIRVPVPLAGLLVAIMVFVAWRAIAVAPHVSPGHELRPVAELRPIIIRGRNAQN
jgi:hypothetical protein